MSALRQKRSSPRDAPFAMSEGDTAVLAQRGKGSAMDDDIHVRVSRIERKVDTLLGLVLSALGVWCADRIAALLQRHFGWNRDWIFFLWVLCLYFGFVIWYGHKRQRD